MMHVRNLHFSGLSDCVETVILICDPTVWTVCFINCKRWDLPSSIDNEKQEGLICGSDYLDFF